MAGRIPNWLRDNPRWAVGALIAVLFVVGVATAEPEPTRTATTGTSTPSGATTSGGSSVTPTPDERFAAMMRDRGLPVSASAVLAREACRILDGGASPDELVLIMAAEASDAGLSDDDITAMGTIVGAGIPAFCPQHNT